MPPIYARITAKDNDGIEEILEPKVIGGIVEDIEGKGYLPKSMFKKYDKMAKKLLLTNGSTLKFLSREAKKTVNLPGKHYIWSGMMNLPINRGSIKRTLRG